MIFPSHWPLIFLSIQFFRQYRDLHACRYGPAEFDLSVGATFGMPARFFEAYHHHIAPLEGFEMRMKVYR